jgi:enoyl-CoA hydratase/carnithine racemase
LEREPTCRCVILTDAGQRTFTVGADISDDLSARSGMPRVVNHALLKNDAYSKPIVAALNGDCIGGGAGAGVGGVFSPATTVAKR